MPTVCDRPRILASSSTALLGPEMKHRSPNAYGPAGQELDKVIAEALQHFHEPAELRSMLAEEADEFEYHPMPPKRAFDILVNVTVTGRGRPVAFEWAEDDSD